MKSKVSGAIGASSFRGARRGHGAAPAEHQQIRPGFRQCFAHPRIDGGLLYDYEFVAVEQFRRHISLGQEVERGVEFQQRRKHVELLLDQAVRQPAVFFQQRVQ